MKVKRKLQINCAVSLVTALVIVGMLLVAMYRISSAMEAAEIADDIITAIIERTLYKNDYILSNSETAKQQWLAKQEQIGRMLESAARKDWSAEDKAVVRDMKEDYGAVGELFTAIVAEREKARREGKARVSTETESRLFAQLTSKTYDTVMHARKLKEASGEHLMSAIRMAGASIIGVIAAVVAAAVASSLVMGRTVTERIGDLREGASAIGAGNLEHTIKMSGDDEFVELSAAFNTMSSQLRTSYLDLEREIADRMRAEEALREREKLFRGTFENAAVGISHIDPDGTILRANGMLCRILGYTQQEISGTSFNALTLPEEREPDWGQYRRLMEGELESYGVEKRYVRKDGSLVWVRVTRSVQRVQDGGALYAIAVIEDIGTRKLAEEELRKAKDELETRVRERTVELSRALEDLRRETEERLAAVEELRVSERLLIQQSRLVAMGEMIANISHQWRQPLNILGLIVQELELSYREGTFSKRYLEVRVAKAMEVIGDMSETIDYFRNFFSPTKVAIPFTIKEVLAKTLALLEEDFRQLQVRVEVLGTEECPMEGMRNEYAQVLLNILSNARDAIRDRKIENPRITVRLFCENGKSVVTIADNAGGIPDTIIDRIFEPYFTTKDPDKGTGIGLFMSKTIIEKNMNGLLTVRNTAEGAEFRIEV